MCGANSDAQPTMDAIDAMPRPRRYRDRDDTTGGRPS